MAEVHRIASTPTPEEVNAAVEQIVASEALRASPQLAAFLRFVVDATLKGQSDRIKGYTIAVEALNRSSDFDPQTDPIVRVEATRLRRAMERYYATAGADSAVRIELVRGIYTPRFSYRTARRAGKLQTVPPADAANKRGNGMPTLSVEPFKTLTAPGTETLSPTALHEKICDAFSRFGTINIQPADEGGDDTAIDYRLIGSVEYRDGGIAHIRCRLLDASNGNVVWSRVFERTIPADGRAAIEDELVAELVVTLLQPFGVLRAHERLRHLSGTGDPRYRAIVEASKSFRSFDAAQHDRACQSLERLVSADASFGAGCAYLAVLYIRKYQFRYPGKMSDQVLLDRALQLARRAIELKPEGSRAYQFLFGVHFARHEIAAAFAAADKAIALNRYDTVLQSHYGGRLIIVGELARGMDMLRKADEFGAMRSEWHNFYMFLGSYLTGDLPGMLQQAGQIMSKEFTLGLVARALAAHATNDTAKAKRALLRLVAIAPAWGSNPRGELDRFFPLPELAERLASDLALAGLAGVQPER